MALNDLEARALETELSGGSIVRSRMSAEQKAAFARYQLVRGVVDDNEDRISSDLLDSTVLNASRYASILAAASALNIQLHRYSGEAYRERMSSHDWKKKAQHDALLVDVRALNRRLFKEFGKEIPPGGIYTGPLDPLIGMRVEKVGDWNPILRQVIGEWSTHLMLGIYYSRKDGCGVK